MKRSFSIALLGCALVLGSFHQDSHANLMDLSADQLIQANGADIQVPGYSVPSYEDWNMDGLNDLIIGEGGGVPGPGKVRVYLNTGTSTTPQFGDYFYAQSNGMDLVVPASGCLGAFPRLVTWNDDSLKDLLVGQADGTAKVFLNTGSAANPTFDAGSAIKVGWPPTLLSVGMRATPTQVDWNNDGRLDLVVGAYDGKIHVFTNCGCGVATPEFTYDKAAGTPVLAGALDLVVPTGRSSPVIVDLDGDGKKDLLTGNTEGQLLMYLNTGTDAAPEFSTATLLLASGGVIDLPGQARSRPFVCDWTGDGRLDILVGAGNGKIHLFQSVPEPATIVLLGLGVLALAGGRKTRVTRI